MLGDNHVVATVAVKDVEAAKKFYGGTLGLTVKNEDEGGVYYASGPTGIFVYPSQYAGTNQATYASWSVADVDATVAELKDKGVSFEHYDGMPNTTLEGDVHVMGEMRMAWFKDPDGNIFALDNQAGK